MIHLTFILLFKLIEGAKNGAYYANNRLECVIYQIWLLCITLVYNIAFQQPVMVFVILPIMIWQYIVFEYNLGKQIHSSEQFLDIALRVFMFFAGADLFMLILTTYLQNVFFKAPINIYIGRDIIEKTDGTNDNTGKSYDIWLFGKQIHIPRISNGYIQLYLGIAGLLAWFVLLQLGYSFNISNVYAYFG